MPTINTLVANAIEKTGDPMAPIKMQEAYQSASELGRMMASFGDQQATQDYSNQLLQDFPDSMDHIASDPNFICALCNLLANAVVAYGSKPK